jgi:hypothetical protein
MTAGKSPPEVRALVTTFDGKEINDVEKLS